MSKNHTEENKAKSSSYSSIIGKSTKSASIYLSILICS